MHHTRRYLSFFLSVYGTTRAREHTGKLVKLERESYREEEELVSNCDEEGNGEIVVVKGMDFSHGATFVFARGHAAYSTRGLVVLTIRTLSKQALNYYIFFDSFSPGHKHSPCQAYLKHLSALGQIAYSNANRERDDVDDRGYRTFQGLSIVRTKKGSETVAKLQYGR